MEYDIADILEMRDASQFLKVMQEVFEERIGNRPFFRITGTATDLHDTTADLGDPVLREILEKPVGRDAGWLVQPLPPLKHNVLGFENDRIDFHHLKFIKNGHLEFWTQIDDHFCWRQSEKARKEHPRLYPYPVVEYPVSFCRLYKRLVSALQIKSSVIFQMQYLNVKGVILLPYQPESIGFMHQIEPIVPLERNRLVFPKKTVPATFEPDPTALDLVQDLYVQFGYGREHIPFFDSSGRSRL